MASPSNKKRTTSATGGNNPSGGSKTSQAQRGQEQWRRPQTTNAQTDQEGQAILAVLTALRPLNNTQRNRVLQYAAQRYSHEGQTTEQMQGTEQMEGTEIPLGQQQSQQSYAGAGR